MADKEYIERKEISKLAHKLKSEFAPLHRAVIDAFIYSINNNIPTADVVEVRRGKWVLTVHKASANYRRYVTASCSECKNEGKEIWSGFFPDFPDEVAEDIILHYAEKVKLKEMGNFCPNCGADMRGNNNENL